MNTHTGALSGLIVLMSCGGGVRDGAANGAAPRPVGAPDPASVTPQAATAIAAPPAATPVPAAAAKLAFHPVVTSGEWLGLHPLLDGSLMISAGPRLLRIDPTGAIDDGPALLAGIELPFPDGREWGVEGLIEMINESGGWTALQVGGTWPGATFLTLEVGRQRPDHVYRWAGDRWARTKPGRAPVLTHPLAIRAWKDHSLLAWRELYAPALDLDAQCSSCPKEMYETPAYKRAEREMLATKQLVVLAGPAQGPPLAGHKISAFDALPGGEVFLALNGGGSLLVLPAAGGESVTLAPPAGPGIVLLHGLVARAADDVIGFGSRDGKAYLQRYDGAQITAIEAPACEPGLASLSIADATWWATCANTVPRSYDEINRQHGTSSLWRRDDAGAWQQVALADGIAARVVVARGADDVWLSAYGERGGTLLHTRGHGPVRALGDLKQIVRAGFFAGEAEY